jgi:hypothetical protein
VQLQAGTMALLDDVAQRIKVARRRFALRASQPFGPWLERRLIKRIGRRSHLEDQRIEAQGYGSFDDGIQFAPQLRHGQALARGEVDVVDGRHPSRAKLARRLHALCCHSVCGAFRTTILRTLLRVGACRACEQQQHASEIQTGKRSNHWQTLTPKGPYHAGFGVNVPLLIQPSVSSPR